MGRVSAADDAPVPVRPAWLSTMLWLPMQLGTLPAVVAVAPRHLVSHLVGMRGRGRLGAAS